MSGQYGYTGPRDAVRGSSRDRIGSDDRDVKTSIDITTKERYCNSLHRF